MRFTKHELAAALTGAAKTVLAAQRRDVRRGKADIDTVSDQMSQYQRFQVLDGLGGQVLPVLVALPDVDVAPGSRPTFTDRQVTETVDSLVEHRLGRVGLRWSSRRVPRWCSRRSPACRRAGIPTCCWCRTTCETGATGHRPVTPRALSKWRQPS